MLRASCVFAIQKLLLHVGRWAFVPARHDIHQIRRLLQPRCFCALLARAAESSMSFFFCTAFCAVFLSWSGSGGKEKDYTAGVRSNSDIESPDRCSKFSPPDAAFVESMPFSLVLVLYHSFSLLLAQVAEADAILLKKAETFGMAQLPDN